MAQDALITAMDFLLISCLTSSFNKRTLAKMLSGNSTNSSPFRGLLGIGTLRPEALTCGDNLDDAKEMAQDALITAMDFYFEDRRSVL